MVKTNSEVRQYRIRDYGTIPVPEIAVSDIENFRHIANRSIQDLCNKKNSNLLIFPDVEHLLKNGIGEQTICTLDDTQLQAGDLMGFIGRGNSQLTINSRFAAEDQEDYFLHYMVQRVFDINLFDLKHASSKNRIFDFLTLLFPYYLKRALKQGIYKKYKTIAHNDANVKGGIDISKQIRLNTPFTGRIAYSVKEFSYDNELTQLIRHTIECIRTTPQTSVLKADPDTEAFVLQICQITPSYSLLARRKIISSNLRPVTHPYYVAYRELQKLCIQILTHRGLKYGQNKDDIYGLLFSGSWLWEEFLYKTLLHDCGFRHPQNRLGKGSIYLFEKAPSSEMERYSRCKRYPDYIKEDFILDAKYKKLDSGHINRDDMHQLISYMYVEQASKGGFIHPQQTTQIQPVVRTLGALRGYGGTIYLIGVPIPTDAKSYQDFIEQMQQVQQRLKQNIKRLEINTFNE